MYVVFYIICCIEIESCLVIELKSSLVELKICLNKIQLESSLIQLKSFLSIYMYN